MSANRVPPTSNVANVTNLQSIIAGVDDTEIGYLNGVTSAIQTQLDAKQASSTAVTLTGTQTLTNKTLTSPALTTPTISTLTTAGDTVYGTGSGVLSRLGIGTVGQVLTVNSGATAPEWTTLSSGGGLTLLSTTTFNNTVTNYTVSGISGSYKNLLIVGSNLQTANAANQPLTFQFNGDTGNNYNLSGIRNNAGTIQSYSDLLYSNYQTGLTLASTTSTSAQLGNFQMTIYNYASTSLYKVINGQGGNQSGGTTCTNTNSGNWQNNTTAISSIKMIEGVASNLKTGTIQIYGVN